MNVTKLNEDQKILLASGSVVAKLHRDAQSAFRAKVEARIREGVKKEMERDPELKSLKAARDRMAWKARDAGVPVSRIARDMLKTTHHGTARAAIEAGAPTLDPNA